MKNFLKITYLTAAFTVLLSACNTKELINLNKNPNRIEQANPDYIFTGALLGMQVNNGNLNQGMQYTAMYNNVGDVGGKQFTFPGSYGYGVYTGQLNRLQQCMNALKMPGDVNKIALVRILRVHAYHTLTDALGDVPYSEAAKGLEGNFKAKYDTQQSIYNDMFKELEEATASMDASKPTFGGADIFYNGDIAKWKKFAYTLMLRLGMHLTKVDPATAKVWVQKAIAGGVMTQISDMALLTFNAQNPNPRAPWSEYNITQDGDNANGYKWSTTFIDHLKNTKDPRLNVLSVVWLPVNLNAKPVVYVPDTSFAVQKGMVPGRIFGKTADFYTYSEPSPIWWNKDSSPLIILGPAEAYLLLAEAALRGWYTGSSAKEAYDLGVTRAMEQWAKWPNVPSLSPNSSTISPAKINAYLTTGYPYKANGTFDQQLEQISVQKWVTLMGDDYEVWTNWRRTGYPVMSWKNYLDPVTGQLTAYPGSVTGGEMWRRLPYPDETLTNNENQQEALKRQGFPTDVKSTQSDLLLGRVWWDKP